MKKKVAISVLTSALLFTSVYADDSYTIETNYFASSVDTPYEFYEKISSNGADYKLANVEYEVIKTNPITLSKQYEELEQPQIDNSILVDGIQYTLKKSDYTEIEMEAGSQFLTHTETYGFRTSQPEIPETWQVEYIDNDESKQAIAVLTEINATSTRWQDGYQFNAIYYGDEDVLYYDFNGILIPNTGSNVPYRGYEEAILNSLDLSTTNTQINDATWSGTTDNGRLAIFNCSMLGSEYSALYTVTVPNHVTAYNVEAEYQLSNPNEAYEIKATALYKKDCSSLVVKAFVGLVVIASLIIIAFLFVLRKRRRKKQEDATQ